MRLWTLHPQYLDAKGLVALWRETLLAQAVLKGDTVGYRHHPQLLRFKAHPDPLAAIASYLDAVYEEAVTRGYRFDRTKINRRRTKVQLEESRGQLAYEWRHLRAKLRARDPAWLRRWKHVDAPQPHPFFRLVAGPVRDWEKLASNPAGPIREQRARVSQGRKAKL